MSTTVFIAAGIAAPIVLIVAALAWIAGRRSASPNADYREPGRDKAGEGNASSPLPPSLQFSDDNLVEMIESLDEGCAIWGPDDRLLVCNSKFKALYPEIRTILKIGVPLEVLVKHRAARHPQLNTEAERKTWIESWMNDHWTKEFVDSESQMLPGQWFRIRKQRLSNGCVLSIHRDTSGDKKVKAELLESNERFRRAFEDAAIGMTMVAPDGRFRHTNQAFSDFIGYTQTELLTMTIFDVTEEDDKDNVIELRQSLLVDRRLPGRVDRKFRRKDGTAVWGLLTRTIVADEDGTVLYTLGQIQDITERRRAEDALRESEERFRDFANSAADRFWETDEQHRFTYMSPSPDKSNMLREQSMIGRTRWELHDPSASEEFLTQLQITMDAQETFRDVLRHVVRPDERDLYIRVTGQPFYNDAGIFLGYRGTTIDVTDRMEAEKKADTIQSRFISVLEQMPEGVTLWDSNQRFVMYNSRFAEMNPKQAEIFEPGMSFDEQLKRQYELELADHTMVDYESWAKNRYDAFMQDASEDEFMIKDRWYYVRRRHLPDGGIIGFHSDITDIKVREEALRHTQKMEAIGQLTGGVAHDFNNLLAAILGNLELIGERVKTTDPSLTHRVERAIRSAQRGGMLTNRLLAFSRRQNLEPRATAIGELVYGMNDLLQRTLGEAVDIEVEADDREAAAQVDPYQLENAILNLAINARDAMNQGGTLLIRSSQINIKNMTLVDKTVVEPGRYIAISVEDTGKGISPEVLEHVFEPFFTTKEVGQGSGLGLSMVYGFVNQTGGYIDIASEVDKGTIVTIYLPLLVGAVEAVIPAKYEVETPRGNGERIFLVEDDLDVREVTTTMLSDLGYDVIDGGDGSSALNLLGRSGGVDLLLTDVVLPNGQSGPDIAQKARSEREGLRILYMTGYSENSEAHQGWLGLGPSLIAKPFEYGELATKVREVLDDPNYTGLPS